MGFITTISFYNDGHSSILENPEEFAKKVSAAMSEMEKGSFHIASSDLAICQKPRHADDHTVYVHMGNTVVDMHAHSDAVARLAKTHPEFFDEMVRFMQRNLNELKRLKGHMEIEKDKK